MGGIRRGERFGAGSRDETAAQERDDDLRRVFGLKDPDEPVEVELVSLERDENIQVRVNGLDMEKVEAYAVIMEEHEGWGPFPPLDVFEDPQTGARRIAGGYHRDASARLASQRLVAKGNPPILKAPAKIHKGSYGEAIDFAEEDNLRHGLALSTADKRNIFERRFKRGHPWATASIRSIARELGVDHKTIGNWRSSLSGENSPVRETEGKKGPEKRVGADGREYRVDRLQKAAQKRAKSKRAAPVLGTDEQNNPPAQSRGLYSPVRTSTSPGVDTADDHVPTEEDHQQWIISQYRKLTGLVEERGRSGEARMTRSIVASLVQAWGQKNKSSTPS